MKKNNKDIQAKMIYFLYISANIMDVLFMHAMMPD